MTRVHILGYGLGLSCELPGAPTLKAAAMTSRSVATDWVDCWEDQLCDVAKARAGAAVFMLAPCAARCS